MKIGLALLNFGELAHPGILRDTAVEARELDFDSIWTTDHFLIPENQPGSYHTTFESLATLAYLSGQTTTIKLGTSIIVVPLRNPVVLAKELATIDVISAGRLILGVGSGWLREEFGYLNADFEKRFRILDDTIRLMRTVWTEDIISYDSDFMHIKGAVGGPKPAQLGRLIPIFVGGNSRLSQKRAAVYGNGWHPVGLSAGQIAEGREYIASLRGTRQVVISARNPIKLGSTDVKYGGASTTMMTVLQGVEKEIMKQIEAFEEAGVQLLVLQPLADSTKELFQTIQVIGESIIPSI